MGSGSVWRAAAVAGRLDRQAHQVVVTLKPDVQERAMADTEKLAAFNAAPFGWLEDGWNEGRGQRGKSGGGRVGHREAPV